MDKSVFDKIIEKAKRILTDETPIDKRIEFCQRCWGLCEIDSRIQDYAQIKVVEGLVNISNSYDGVVKKWVIINPFFKDLVEYLSNDTSEWQISTYESDMLTPRWCNERDVDFYDYAILYVFRNEETRLKQIKVIDCLDDFSSPQEQENDYGGVTQPPQQENSLEQEKKAEISQFYAYRDENVYEQIFTALKSKGYLANDCPLEDWLYICGIKQYNQPKKPIEWIKLQNELMWVVATLFRPHNENDCWAIAESCFTIRGEKINRGTMITTYSKYTNKSVDELPLSIKKVQGIIDDVLSGAKG